MIFALLIFAVTRLLILARRLRFLPVGRPAAGLVGAVACVVAGVVSPEQAYAAINGDVLVLLLGMVMLAAHLGRAGFFEWGAAVALRKARTPQRLLTVVVLSSGLLSAFLVSEFVCLFMAPLVVRLVRRGRLGPTLFLMALVTSANIGSVATLAGNPQNMLVGSMSGISFARFFAVLGPLGLLALVMNRLLLPRFYAWRPPTSATARLQADSLETPFDDADELPSGFRHTIVPELRRGLLAKSLFCSGLAITGFFAGLDMAWTALAAGTLLLLFAGWEPRQAFRAVDWPLFLFFGGLFVVVEGLRTSGVTEWLFATLQPVFGTQSTQQGWTLALVSLVGSQISSNVPYVLIAGEWIPALLDPETGWFLLAMASTFACNLTLMSSVTSVLVLEQGRGVADIGFGEYLRYGVVVTLSTLVLGTLWVLWVT